MSEHNFVTIRRRSYLLETLDEENRVFVGYRLTKEIITEFLDDKLDNLYGLKTTIMFGEHGGDVYIHEATLDTFKQMWYISGAPNFRDIISEEEYNEALEAKEIKIPKPWWQPKRSYLRRINKIINTIHEYKNQQFQLSVYNERITEREEWLLRVKEQWFS